VIWALLADGENVFLRVKRIFADGARYLPLCFGPLCPRQRGGLDFEPLCEAVTAEEVRALREFGITTNHMNHAYLADKFITNILLD